MPNVFNPSISQRAKFLLGMGCVAHPLDSSTELIHKASPLRAEQFTRKMNNQRTKPIRLHSSVVEMVESFRQKAKQRGYVLGTLAEMGLSPFLSWLSLHLLSKFSPTTCPVCHSQIQPNARTCPKCTTKLDWVAVPNFEVHRQ